MKLAEEKKSIGGQLRALFNEGRSLLNDFFERLNMEEATQLLSVLKECRGMILVTGVGKSGFVAEKFAMTLTSTGTRALYVSPMNALHGDIGIATKDDVFVMMSKSGETSELLQLVPFLRHKGVKLVSIVSCPNSRLSKVSDLSITLPLAKELCPFDLVPTTSVISQMIFGDVLAIALMNERGFSLDDYAKNHPAGRIGRRLICRVKDLMLVESDIPLALGDDKLFNTLVELSNKKCGCVLVVDKEKRLLGIFTDGDLRRSLQKYGPNALQMTLEGLMSKEPRCIEASVLATEALAIMEGDAKRPISVLAVVSDERKVVGIIRLHDILQEGI